MERYNVSLWALVTKAAIRPVPPTHSGFPSTMAGQGDITSSLVTILLLMHGVVMNGWHIFCMVVGILWMGSVGIDEVPNLSLTAKRWAKAYLAFAVMAMLVAWRQDERIDQLQSELVECQQLATEQP